MHLRLRGRLDDMSLRGGRRINLQKRIGGAFADFQVGMVQQG